MIHCAHCFSGDGSLVGGDGNGFSSGGVSGGDGFGVSGGSELSIAPMEVTAWAFLNL